MADDGSIRSEPAAPSGMTGEPRRGPKPGVRSSFQERQRASSREAILAAANDLLDAKAFDDIAIEDVLARAPCSRATFYRHFRSKYELALALYRQVFASSMPLWDALVGVAREPSMAVSWVERMVDHYRIAGRASVLILQLGVTDARFHQQLRDDRHRLIDHLGAILPAVARVAGSSPDARRARADADLLLMLLDRICAEIAVHGSLPHQGDYIELIAARLAGFLKGGTTGIDNTDCIVE